MSESMYKWVITIGMVGLLHSGYSAAQHRSYVRLVGEQFGGLPQDIVIQTLVTLLMTISSIVLLNTRHLREIRALDDLKEKTCESIDNRPNFYLFNHRGRLLR